MEKDSKKARLRKYLLAGCLVILGIAASLYFSMLWKIYRDYPIVNNRLGAEKMSLEKVDNCRGYERISFLSGSLLVPTCFSTRRVIIDQEMDVPSLGNPRASSILLENDPSSRNVINIEACLRYTPFVDVTWLHWWKGDGYRTLESALRSRFGLLSVTMRSAILSSFRKPGICRVQAGELRGFLTHGDMVSPAVTATSPTMTATSPAANPEQRARLHLYTWHLFDDDRQYSISVFVMSNSLSMEQIKVMVASFRPAR